MKRFIKDLYHANYDPQAAANVPDSAAMIHSNYIAVKEAELNGILPEAGKDCLKAYSRAWAALNNDIALDAFTAGFCMGAGLAHDAFADDGVELVNIFG